MKRLRVRSGLGAMLLVMFGFTMVQCDNEVVPWTPKTTDLVITEYVYSNPEDFSLFGEAMEYTGIENLLRVRGPFTLFLPTDEAMQAYLTSKGASSVTDIDVQTMEDFVYNHVLQGEVSSGAIGLGTLPYKNGLNDFIASDFAGIEILLNKVAIVVDRDIPTSNGYVHHIDHVLEPITKTVVDVLEDLGGYSIFLEGVEQAGYTDTLRSIEFEYGNTTARSRYTVFAIPDTLYNRAGINSVDDLIDRYSEDDDLTSSSNGFNQYMVYHLISGTHYFTDFLPDDIYYVITGDNYLNIVVEDDFKINKTDTTYIGFHYELSNYPAKNGAIHTVNTQLENSETSPVVITHQVTDYFDLQQGPYYLNYYQRFYDGQNTFEGIKWEGEFLQYYLKPAHNMTDDDALNMNGHFWIEITTPQIRAGDYMFSGYGFQGSGYAVFSCFFDDEYLGVYDPNEGSWGGAPVDIGEVSLEVTKSHKIRIETTVPGQMFWDFVRFTPIE